tara:strand:+ start:151996 stop:153747 length:1752 start_codon:yes stop_codon:yes gene_type:complete
MTLNARVGFRSPNNRSSSNRFAQRWLSGGLVVALVLVAGNKAARGDHQHLSGTASTAVSVPASDASALIDEGLRLEQDELWTDAISHYEKASRQYPQDKTLYQRLIICRLRYDVNRRFQDQSYLGSLKQLGTGQALDLYAEVLANLESHYVENVDWARTLLHGTAALEIALEEPCFIQETLAGVDPAAIERFRMNVHRQMIGRSTATRFDLRANVAYVAGLAHTELGMSGTATVLEYLSGAISTLDPYTRLLSGDQLDEMFSNIEGNFVGLGIELKADEDSLQILSVIPGGPAAEAGILPGEQIVRVESAKTTDNDPDYVADLLRGMEHSYVSITVVDKAGKSREMNIQRRRVDVPCVENVHLVDPVNKVGYFRLTNFQKTTTRDVERELWNLQRQGMRSLVLDVRGNPGGLLSAAVELADRFLSNGRIVTTRGRNTRENFDYSAHRANTWNVPLVVLIDENSASASEIFAGAISDNGRGTLVGKNSYGKGSVQGIFKMQTAKFGLCLTTAKFYSPSGRAISQNGVLPHVEVEPTYIAARPNKDGELTLDGDDAVLQRAVQQLTASVNVPSQMASRNLIGRLP